MDALDIRILRAMGIQPYGRSPRPLDQLRAPSIARALRASPERIRARIGKMEASGLIEGYDLYPNYRHLGLDATWYYYQLEDEDEAAAAGERLAPVEGIGACCWFMGGIVCANVLYRSPSDLARKLQLLERLAGKGRLRKLYDVEMPHAARPLSRLDWQILQALRGQALRPLPDVARAVRTSTKTVRRRLDRLEHEGSLLPFPSLDPSKAEGAILFYMAVRFSSEAPPNPEAAVARALEPALLATDHIAAPDLGSLMFLLAAKSTAQVDELRRATARLPGVAKAKALMFAGADEDEGWLDEAIAERAGRAAPG